MPVDEYPSRERALALVDASRRGDYRAMTKGDSSYDAYLCYQAYGYEELEPGNRSRRIAELWMAKGNQPVSTTPQQRPTSDAPPITYGMSPRSGH